MARKRVKSRPGLLGMVYYYDENGKPIGKSRPGLLEGTRVYSDQDGKYVGKSRPGFFAKEVFIDTDKNHITTYDSPFGEVHFKDGTPVGHTRPGFFNFEYTTIDAEEEFFDDECCDGDTFDADMTEAILDEMYEDEDREEYVPPPPRNTLLKKLQFILSFLVFCMVVACVCATMNL